MKKILLSTFVALCGVLLFTACSNDDLAGVDKYNNYQANFQKVFGRVNPNQDFNTQRSVGIDVSVANTQGNYTLRVFSAMPNTKGAKLLGKFENLNAGQVSTVRVDAHKAAKNLYCMVDNGVNNRTKEIAIPSSGKASVKFDGIASSRNASTRATGDVVDIMVDDDLFNPNSATIAFEDLGSSDDFDFNDAVIKVEFVNGESKLKVTLMAVGALLPLRLYCAYPIQQPLVSVRAASDDYELVPIFEGQELHAVMGESVNTMINTNWKGDGASQGKDNVAFVSCEIDVPEDFSLSDDAFPFLLEVDGKKDGQYRITNNGPGAIPQVIVIGDYEEREEPHVEVATRALSYGRELFYYIPWRWSKERVSVVDAYPNINTWIEDDPDDFSFIINGVVDDNLYDGYNPLAAYDDEDDIELQAVDLGLPSGTLWANMNVGASAPEKVGGYYGWGETIEKDWYDLGTYPYDGEDGNPYFFDFGDIRGTQYDVAHAVMGGDWEMPTLEQFQELYAECVVVPASRKGMPGIKFTGPNGNSIFFPLPGYYEEDELYDFGTGSYYWTSTLGESYDGGDGAFSYMIEDGAFLGDQPFYGQSVRAVINPIWDNHEEVDLGLPSGLRWATTNVGANVPEEYGAYFAWGETEEKEVYDESTYTYYRDGNYVDIGADIAGTQYDVASRKWGFGWRMPTKEEFEELYNNTTNTWTTQNGVYGRLFTANGNSIFLPAAGHLWSDVLYYNYEIGYYWSSTQNTYDSSGAWEFYFNSSTVYSYPDNRSGGRSVRPVRPAH